VDHLSANFAWWRHYLFGGDENIDLDDYFSAELGQIS
jgi:hypothetical protein